MPNMDKTGPMGTGAYGQGRGGCQNKNTQAMGFGRGNGCGRKGQRGGFGFCMKNTMSAADEKTFLETNIEACQNQLNAMKKRLSELK